MSSTTERLPALGDELRLNGVIYIVCGMVRSERGPSVIFSREGRNTRIPLEVGQDLCEMAALLKEPSACETEDPVE